MKLLEKAITEKGKVLPGNVLKVGAILNNRMDVKLLSALAEDIAAHCGDKGVTDVLTVEASGIALAVLVAEKLGVLPEECLMVGNDAEDDLSAREAGMMVYLMPEFLVNKKNVDISGVPQGGFADLRQFIENL